VRNRLSSTFTFLLTCRGIFETDDKSTGKRHGGAETEKLDKLSKRTDVVPFKQAVEKLITQAKACGYQIVTH
jgi:hypothetical protein